MNTHLRRSGDRILIGRQEEKLPSVLVLSFRDFLRDILPVVFPRGVLEPVGEDREDDLIGTMLFRQSLDSLPKAFDRPPDRIQQGRRAARPVGILVEAGHLTDRKIIDRHFVFVIEQNQSDAGKALHLLLIAKEFIETADGSFSMGLHRARAVEDKCDFSDGGCGGFRGHGYTLPQGVGQLRGVPL